MNRAGDRHIVSADLDSDPTLHVDAVPDPDPDWHQNDADPHADPTPSFTPIEDIRGSSLLFTTMLVYNDVPFSSIAKVHDFTYF
jgi:hypothetical protein